MGAPPTVSSVKLKASAFMAADGSLVPLETHAPGAPADAGGYLQFAIDPRIPVAILVDIEVPGSAKERLIRVSVREGKRLPAVHWVAVPQALGLDKPPTVHVPLWLNQVGFCADLEIEVSARGRPQPMLRRVVRFACGE